MPGLVMFHARLKILGNRGAGEFAACGLDVSDCSCFWQQCLYFLPLSHGHGALREIFLPMLPMRIDKFDERRGAVTEPHRWTPDLPG